jgi:hypothetical protein
MAPTPESCLDFFTNKLTHYRLERFASRFASPLLLADAPPPLALRSRASAPAANVGSDKHARPGSADPSERTGRVIAGRSPRYRLPLGP